MTVAYCVVEKIRLEDKDERANFCSGWNLRQELYEKFKKVNHKGKGANKPVNCKMCTGFRYSIGNILVKPKIKDGRFMK